jgi:hypothetical protein
MAEGRTESEKRRDLHLIVAAKRQLLSVDLVPDELKLRQRRREN